MDPLDTIPTYSEPLVNPPTTEPSYDSLPQERAVDVISIGWIVGLGKLSSSFNCADYKRQVYNM